MWRWRWVGVALFAVLAIQALLPEKEEPPAFATVVAARPLSGGERVADGDVRVVRFAEDLPDVAREAELVVGEFVVTPVAEGAPIFASNLLSSEFLGRAPAGTVIAALPVADAGGLAILQPGVTVNLYSPPDEFTDGAATLLARDVLVAGIAHEKGTSTFLGTTEDTRVFYLAVPEKEIHKVIGASTRAPLHAVLSGPASG